MIFECWVFVLWLLNCLLLFHQSLIDEFTLAAGPPQHRSIDFVNSFSSINSAGHSAGRCKQLPSAAFHSGPTDATNQLNKSKISSIDCLACRCWPPFHSQTALPPIDLLISRCSIKINGASSLTQSSFWLVMGSRRSSWMRESWLVFL